MALSITQFFNYECSDNTGNLSASDLSPDHSNRTISHREDHLEIQTFKFIFMLFAKLQVDMRTKIMATCFDQVYLCTSIPQPHSLCLFPLPPPFRTPWICCLWTDRVLQRRGHFLCFPLPRYVVCLNVTSFTWKTKWGIPSEIFFWMRLCVYIYKRHARIIYKGLQEHIEY